MSLKEHAEEKHLFIDLYCIYTCFENFVSIESIHYSYDSTYFGFSDC